MTPIPTPADERREAYAKIIDPWAFSIDVSEEAFGFYKMDQINALTRRIAALAKADAILASEPAREEAPSLLWCCHVRGPDDVIPAPDYTTALKLADAVNAVETDPERPLRAVPALWPWSAESHAGGPTAAPPSPILASEPARGVLIEQFEVVGIALAEGEVAALYRNDQATAEMFKDALRTAGKLRQAILAPPSPGDPHVG